MTRRATLQLALVAVAGLLLLAVPTGTATGGPAAPAAPAGSATGSPQTEEEQKAHWQERKRTLVNRVDSLERKLSEAQEAYTRGKRRNRLRGGARYELKDMIETTEAELATARQELEDLPDEARRAGVPPGWLRD